MGGESRSACVLICMMILCVKSNHVMSYDVIYSHRASPAPDALKTTLRRRATMMAVTFYNQSGWPLFRYAGSSSSEPQAVAEAQGAFAAAVAAIAASCCLDEADDDLVVDDTKTKVQRVATREGWQLNYFVRIAGELKDPPPPGSLSRSDANVLLRAVIGADERLLSAMTDGLAIEVCPYHEWSQRTGWVRIGCSFRTRDVTGRCADIRPRSPEIRAAVRLISLHHLLAAGETGQQRLTDRKEIGSHSLGSATLRAALRVRGVRAPAALITWLRDCGHNEIADRVEMATKGMAPSTS